MIVSLSKRNCGAFPPAEGKRPAWLTDDELERLYWDEGLSQSEISTRVGATASGVGYWMAESDIETR